MIGTIALNNMSPVATGFVCSLLEIACPLQPHMKGLGRWADNPPDELLWTRDQHFANIPYRSCGAFDLARDCATDCIVSALRGYIITSMDESAPKTDRQTAIRMIIHLVGDIHNPVHMGYLEDKGGNNIPVGGFDSARYPANLHNLWDFHIPIRFKNTPFVQNIQPPQRDVRLDSFASSFVESKVQKDALQTSLKQLLTEIASETTAYVCQAYRHMVGDQPGKGPWIQSGEAPSPMYMNRMSLVAQDRIRKAGVRLAKILDFIATHQLTQSVDGGGDQSPSPAKAPQSVSPDQGIEPGPDDTTKAVKDNVSFPMIIFFITICMI